MPVDPHLLLAWVAACLVLIVTPGPDMAFALGQAMAGGARRGWAATAGIMAGATCHVGMAALGVAALLAANPLLFQALRWAGALYLFWLGAQALRAAWRGQQGIAARSAGPGGMADAFRQGFLTNLLNPKVGLFFLAILPQFVAPGRAPAWVQMLILGPMLPLMSLPFFAVLLHGAERLTARLRQGRAARWLEGAMGGLFLGLGARILLGR